MPRTTQPVYHNQPRSAAEALLKEYQQKLHAATQIVDGELHTHEAHRVAFEQFQTCQAYLLDALTAGIATGSVPF